MSFQQRLKRGLQHARGFTEKILAEIPAPEGWMNPVAPGTNHALWIAGHLAIADNSFIRMIDPDQHTKHESFQSLFGKGSQPHEDLAAYPAVDEILQFMRERRQVLYQLLDTSSDECLGRDVSPPAPKFATDVASVFQLAVWHEGLHAGQLSVIHRHLGHAPLADRPPAA